MRVPQGGNRVRVRVRFGHRVRVRVGVRVGVMYNMRVPQGGKVTYYYTYHMLYF